MPMCHKCQETERRVRAAVSPLERAERERRRFWNGWGEQRQWQCGSAKCSMAGRQAERQQGGKSTSLMLGFHEGERERRKSRDRMKEMLPTNLNIQDHSH